MLYTNCDKFHCSMAHPDEDITGEIAVHLSITRKPKYPIISPLADICHFNGIDCCPMWLECDRNQKVKPARIE